MAWRCREKPSGLQYRNSLNKEGNSFTACQAKETVTIVPAIGVLNEKAIEIRMKTGESAVNSEFITYLNNEYYFI